jgi:hypothetical protein
VDALTDVDVYVSVAPVVCTSDGYASAVEDVVSSSPSCTSRVGVGGSFVWLCTLVGFNTLILHDNNCLKQWWWTCTTVQSL